MKAAKLLKCTLLLFALLFSMSLAWATQCNASVINPAASGEVSNGTEFNMSFENKSDIAITNVSFAATDSRGNTISLGFNDTPIDNGVNGVHWATVTVQTNGTMYDSVTYTITGRAWLNNTINCSDTNTLVTVDNTEPTVNLVKPAASTLHSADNGTKLSATVYNASACNFTINNKIYQGAMTGTTNGAELCTYWLNKSQYPPEGTYTVTVEGVDLSATGDNIADTSLNVIFDVEASGLKGRVLYEEMGKAPRQLTSGDGGVWLLLVGIGVLVFRKELGISKK